VVNHSVPNVPKEYVHRVGRTARAGRGGDAVTLTTPKDINLIKAIEELINTKLVEYAVDGEKFSHLFPLQSLNHFYIFQKRKLPRF